MKKLILFFLLVSLAVGQMTTNGGHNFVGTISSDFLSMHMVLAPSSAPTATAGSAGSVNGGVAYLVSFVTASGETQPYATAASTTASSQQVTLTNVPVSSDVRVIGRNIYRSTNGSAYYRLTVSTTIADNTTTIYLDNKNSPDTATVPTWHNTTGGIISWGGTPVVYIAQNADIGIGIGAADAAQQVKSVNQLGGYNLFLGNLTGSANTLYSTAVGHGPLSSLQPAYDVWGNAHTCMGVVACAGLTYGGYDVAVGGHTLRAGNNYSRTTAIGTFAGYSMSHADHSYGGNTLIGFAAGFGLPGSNAGYENTFIGDYSNATSSTIYGGINPGQPGSCALNHDVTTGNYNIGIGFCAGLPSSTQPSNCTFIGKNAGCWNGSNTANIGGHGADAQSFFAFHVSGDDGGVTPSITSGFGTSPTLDSASTDNAGRITIGSGGSATSGVITFGGTWQNTAPACVANDETTGLQVRATATTTTLTITGASAFGASDKVTYLCMGLRGY